MPQRQQQAAARPRVVARPQGYATAGLGARIPQAGLGGGSPIKGRSVFDEAVRGPGAQVRQVPLRMANVAFQQVNVPPWPSAPPPPAPMMGQQGAGTPPPQASQERTAVERVIQRELPPVGLSRQEAAAIAAALGPAIDASARAIQDGVSCGRVDTFVVQEARVLREFLDRFAAVARADDRTERLSAEDFAKIDDVLACQATYEQVSSARGSSTTALVVGGIVAGAILLALAT